MIAVVPLAGTWIETISGADIPKKPRSFPLRERGLKREFIHDYCLHFKSFPLRERGLKHLC